MNITRASSALLFISLFASFQSSADTVMVMMQSDPSGAKVFVDGSADSKGTTPCAVEVSVGEHKAKFVLDGYQPDEKTFTAKPTGGVTVKSVLKPLRALFTVKTVPSHATVYIDGTEKGKTPVIGTSLDPGDHEIRMDLAGYASVTQTVSVQLGEHKVIDIKLEKSSEPPPPPPTPKETAGSAPANQPADATATAPADTTQNKPADTTAPVKPPKLIQVPCWVCEGTGLLQSMGCPKCGGKGWEGINPCANCGGSRRIPLTCKACNGTGKIVGEGREGVCGVCGGKGAPPCPYCKGTGKTPRMNPEAYNGPTQTCPSCTGSGREMHGKCKICGGKGTMTVASGSWFRIARCYYCKGASEVPPHCGRCQGTGVIGTGQNAACCMQCCGTGQAGTVCAYCQGNGWIPAPK